MAIDKKSSSSLSERVKMSEPREIHTRILDVLIQYRVQGNLKSEQVQIPITHEEP